MKPYLPLSLTFALALNTQPIPARAAIQPRAGDTEGQPVVWTNIAGFWKG